MSVRNFTSLVRNFTAEFSSVRNFHCGDFSVRNFTTEGSSVRNFRFGGFSVRNLHCGGFSVRNFTTEGSSVRNFRFGGFSVRNFHCGGFFSSEFSLRKVLQFGISFRIPKSLEIALLGFHRLLLNLVHFVACGFQP